MGTPERWRSYPWSSLVGSLATAQHRPGWIRVDRVLGEPGMGADLATGRWEFEVRLEVRRRKEEDEAAGEPVRRGGCLGSAPFQKELLGRMEWGAWGNRMGELRRESAEARAERIIAQELRRQGWRGAALAPRRQSDPVKRALGAQLRRETTPCLPAGRWRWGGIARRLTPGTRKSAAVKLHWWIKGTQK